MLQMSLAVSGLGARVIPWFKQILKVFVCGPAEHNGLILKVLWAKRANQCQVLSALNVVLTGVQAPEYNGAQLPLAIQVDLESGLDRKQRQKNVRGAFYWHGPEKPDLHVALIDDVMTTGTTVTECARVLKNAGAKRVDVWVAARAIPINRQ